jgi:glycosyltransferase involved in cell wall biosynthesis
LATVVATKRRLRVVHIAPGLDMGGLEKLLVEFARHADRRRFALRFVSLGGRGVLAEEIEACGWPVTALDAPAGLRPGLMLRLSHLLRRWQSDVIHTHDDRAHIYGTFAGRLANVPRILHTRHGRSPHLSRRQQMLVGAASRLIDRFVCVSDDSGRLAVEQGVAHRKVRTVRNGIDVQRFPCLGPRSDGPAVIVARLSPEKDIDSLLHATALVVRDDPSFRLEITGDGTCLAALRQTTASLRLEEHVRFLGQVRDIPSVLARAGLFVLSSISEGISLTLLEAMASGLPIVATRVGGNPEVVAEGETGFLVPPQNPSALADALLRLRRDPALGAQLGQASRQRVEALFDVRRMIAEYEQMYRGVSALNAAEVRR